MKNLRKQFCKNKKEAMTNGQTDGHTYIQTESTTKIIDS